MADSIRTIIATMQVEHKAFLDKLDIYIEANKEWQVNHSKADDNHFKTLYGKFDSLYKFIAIVVGVSIVIGWFAKGLAG